MNITNAKQIIPNPPGLKIFENFRLDIICTHTTPNTHANTKLHRWKNGKLIPLKIDNPNGMEDAHEVVRGSNRLMACEIKDIGGEQWSTGIFKSTDGINYTQTDRLKPTSNNWEKDSVSSPTFYDDDTDNIPMLYEGRYRENWDDFKTGIAQVNFKTGKIVNRSSLTFLNDRLVPDDIWEENGWYWYSFHTRTDSMGWYALLYKSRAFGSRLIFESNFTFRGGTIGSYYRDKSFGWKNYEGIWQVINEPTNGGNVKPQIELNNDKLKVTNPVTGEKYAWQVKYSSGRVEWFGFGSEVDIRDGDKIDGNRFWCYPMSNKSTLSNVVPYETDEEPPIVLPPTGEFDKVKTLLLLDEANATINLAREEVLKA